MSPSATSILNDFNTFFFSYGIKVIVSIAVFIVAYYFAKYTFKFLEISARKMKRPLKYPNTSFTMIKVSYLSIATLIMLGIFNINLWPILASLGVVGLVVGLALQQPLGNFFSGLMIFVTDAVNEGEALDIDGTSGVIYAIKLNHTIVDTWDGKRIYIPNTKVWSSKVIKFWPKVARRVEMEIGVPYSLNSQELAKITGILKKVTDEESLVYKGDNYSKEENYGPVSNYATFEGFGASSINFKLRFWVLRKDYFDAIEKVAVDIYKAFEIANISIPFNQLDVHVDGKIG